MFPTTTALLGQIQLGEDSTIELSPDQLARLFQQRSQTRLIWFDEQPVASASVSCLDASLWEKFRTPRSAKDDTEFLTKLGLLAAAEDGELLPSVAGVLLASRAPHEIISNARIQAVVYRGEKRDAAYQLDAKDIVGPLDEQVVEGLQVR